MTTGYLGAGVCWPTTSEATDAHYSNYQPLVVNQSAGTYAYTPIKDAGVWKYSRLNIVDGVRAIYGTALPTNVYGTCTLPDPPQVYPTTLTCTNCGGGTVTPGTPGWDGSYDYSAAAAAWSFAFVTVLGTWLIAKNLGILISAIKRW